MSYIEEYNQSLLEPIKYWEKQALNLPWFKKSDNILEVDDIGYAKWFSDAECNISYMMLDYHVMNGKADNIALIYDSPVTNTKRKFTYGELLDLVSKFADVLYSRGIRKGDTAVIYMPMVPEAIVAMIACARIGVIHSVVFGGFAAHELAIRIDDAKPKVLITANAGMEFDKTISYLPLVKEAYHHSFHQPEYTIVLHRDIPAEKLDLDSIDFYEAISVANNRTYEVMKSTDPLYIIYTSGTTGKPKGIVRDTGAYAVALNYSLEKIYNVHEGDVFWAASDIGWVVGHSYITYAPLIRGCTTLVYEGKPVRTPDYAAFWRVVEEYKVNLLFAAPTAFRAIKKEDAEATGLKKYSIKSLRSIFVAGERCDPATYHWLHEYTQLPVIDHWWQTESGWPMIANLTGVEMTPIKPGSSNRAVPGFDIKILNEEGQELPANKEGYIAIKLPLPPGCLTGIWNDEERFRKSYLQVFDGYYFTGDGGYKDQDDYVYIMGRVDDVINVSGHRLSTGEMEEMIASHPDVAECAVVGIADELRGQRPVGFIVLKDGRMREELEIEKELIDFIRNQIGAVAYFRNAVLLKRLPKTRSGKILRKNIRQIADAEEFNVPSTIDDPLILEEIKQRLIERKIGQISNN